MSKKYTIEDCKKIAESRGGKCLSEEYEKKLHKNEMVMRKRA